MEVLGAILLGIVAFVYWIGQDRPATQVEIEGVGAACRETQDAP